MMLSFVKTTTPLVLLVASVQATVDVTFKSITCNASLPIYPQFLTHCKPCSFGDTAEFTGKLIYSGLTVEEGIFSSDLTIDTIGYTMPLMKSVTMGLCHDSYIVPLYDNNYACPQDGEYSFALSYTLPEMTWISSGWTGIAHLNVVDASKNQLAYCEFKVVTSYQTNSASGNIFTQTPSAKVALGIFLAALAAILVGCCLCCCNSQRQARKRKSKFQTDSDYSRMQGDLA